jgi:hypothetical protein
MLFGYHRTGRIEQTYGYGPFLKIAFERFSVNQIDNKGVTINSITGESSDD